MVMSMVPRLLVLLLALELLSPPLLMALPKLPPSMVVLPMVSRMELPMDLPMLAFLPMVALPVVS